MRRLILPALLLTLSLPAAPTTVRAEQRPTFVTNQNVTFLMKNGERQSGTLVYHNDANFNLMVNGQEKAYPVSDIALVDFSGGGQPSTQELSQLPTSNDPPELQRHMVVLRDGTTVRGKLYTIKENSISFDNEQGQRRDFELSNISRLYVSAPGARQLYASQLSQGQSPVTGTAGTSGAIVVNAAQGWADTGRTVRRNQRLTFDTTGEIKFGSGAGTGRDPGRQGRGRVAADAAGATDRSRCAHRAHQQRHAIRDRRGRDGVDARGGPSFPRRQRQRAVGQLRDLHGDDSIVDCSCRWRPALAGPRRLTTHGVHNRAPPGMARGALVLFGAT